MPVFASNAGANRLLALLPPEELTRLLAEMEEVPLESKQVLYEPHALINDAFFPCSGVVSWLAETEEGASIEVATIGNEGMVGSRLVLGGDRMPAKVIVHVPGRAMKIKRADLHAEIQQRRPLVGILHRYLNALFTQITQSAACNALHPLEKRFCRWLLMTHDRVRSDHFPLTHELLAQMLGVRRASVTEVARKLQKAGLIRYVHGKITVLNRPGLEAAACGCYRAVKEDFDHLLG